MVVFSWEPAVSSNPVTYTLTLSNSFGQIIYRQEDIVNTVVALGPEKLALIDNNNYYWKVQAIDSYGAIRWSAEIDWNFHTNFLSNGLPGIIQGYVKDSFGNPIADALVTAGSTSFTSSGNGAFAIAVPGGSSLTLNAVKGGYSAPGSPVSVASGGTLNTAITMTDSEIPVVTAFSLPVVHSGLTIPITTLAATDNAGAVTIYCITESNSYAGCSWGAKPDNMLVSPSATTLYAWARDAAGNISAPFEAPLNKTIAVTISGAGSGKVYSAPVNIDCSYMSGIMTGGCSSHFNYGSDVSLIASPEWNALFGGWGGDTCSGFGSCVFNPLTSSQSVTASFTLNQLAKVGSVEYPTLQEAYNNAAPLSGSNIKARQFTFKEELLFDILDKVVSIEGGLDGTYENRIGITSVEGSIRIRQGTVRIRGPLVVK